MPVSNTDYSTAPSGQEIEHYRQTPYRTLSIYWRINIYCNYECSYCHPDAHQSTPDFLELGQYLLIVDKIFAAARKSKLENVTIFMLGGEPTLNPYFTEIVTKILSFSSEFRILLNVTTNLSRPISYFRELHERTKHLRGVGRALIKLASSFHGETVNTERMTALYGEKLKFLGENDFYPSVSFVYNSSTFEQYLPIYTRFREQGFSVAIAMDSRITDRKGVNGEAEKYSITAEQMARLKAAMRIKQEMNSTGLHQRLLLEHFIYNSDAFFDTSMNRAAELKGLDGKYHYLDPKERTFWRPKSVFKGVLCEAGMTGFMILPNGDTFNAKAPCRSRHPMANILTDVFDTHDVPMMCDTSSVCGCASATLLEKYTINSPRNFTRAGIDKPFSNHKVFELVKK